MIDFEGLENFLITLTKEDFEKNEKILKGHSVDDLNFFGTKIPLLPGQIINYGDYFLVDVIGNTLTVAKLTKRKFRTKNGRLVKCKTIKTIIKDCWKTYGSPLNGYWVIPKEFIK